MFQTAQGATPFGLCPQLIGFGKRGLRAFSLLLCTGKRREVRLFLRKSHVGSGCSVCTRSENAIAQGVGDSTLTGLLVVSRSLGVQEGRGNQGVATRSGFRVYDLRGCSRRQDW
jgi:hypothetical protein